MSDRPLWIVEQYRGWWVWSCQRCADAGRYPWRWWAERRARQHAERHS